MTNEYTRPVTFKWRGFFVAILSVEFKYDHNGLRTQKKFTENGVTTTYDYTLHGKLITHLTKRVLDLDGAETSEEPHFFYDAQARPAFMEYAGIKYRYVHNLQGDIVAIVDAAGNPVVEYHQGLNNQTPDEAEKACLK